MPTQNPTVSNLAPFVVLQNPYPEETSQIAQTLHGGNVVTEKKLINPYST